MFRPSGALCGVYAMQPSAQLSERPVAPIVATTIAPTIGLCKHPVAASKIPKAAVLLLLIILISFTVYNPQQKDTESTVLFSANMPFVEIYS